MKEKLEFIKAAVEYIELKSKEFDEMTKAEQEELTIEIETLVVCARNIVIRHYKS